MNTNNVRMNQSLLWMCEKILTEEDFKMAKEQADKFKEDSVCRAIVYGVATMHIIDGQAMELLLHGDARKFFDFSLSARASFDTVSIIPKLACIALNPRHCTSVRLHLSKNFSINDIQEHTDNPSYFLPKNSMPVEKEMGLDKPGSLQRIIALEKMVKELKKELESVKSLDNRI